jgi:hypothetical protein
MLMKLLLFLQIWIQTLELEIQVILSLFILGFFLLLMKLLLILQL